MPPRCRGTRCYCVWMDTQGAADGPSVLGSVAPLASEKNCCKGEAAKLTTLESADAEATTLLKLT
jgi:hypothetical protein